MLISEKEAFRIKSTSRYKEGHFMTTGSIYQEYTVILIYIQQIAELPNTRKTPSELKGETDKCTNTAGGFNTPHSVIKRTCRKSIQIEKNLIHTINSN